MTGPRIPTPDEAEFQAWKAKQQPQREPGILPPPTAGTAPRDALANVPADEAEFQDWKKANPGLLQQAGKFLAGVVAAPLQSAADVISPTMEAAERMRNEPENEALVAKFGHIPREGIHGVTGKQRALGAIQTAANLAAPGIMKALPRIGAPVAGAVAGAAYDPEHPVRGAAIGGTFSGLLAGAPAAGGMLLDAAGARPRTYAGTPSLGTAVADASDALSPGLATRDISNPPPSNVGSRLLKAGAKVAGVESIEQRTVRMLSEAMQADGISVEQAIQKVSKTTGLKPETIMDIAGQNVMGLARGASMVPGSQAKHLIPETLQQRALGQEERLLGDLLQTTGQKGRTNIPKTMKALHDEANTAATPFYNELRKLESQDMEAAAQYFERPAFQAGYGHAETVAANQGKKLPKLFDDVKDEAGKVVGKKLRKMDFETVDRVKRALDDVLYDAEKPMPSELATKAGGIGNEGRRVIEDARREFLDIADQIFPGYKDARDVYAGPSALNRAVDKGRKILSMSPDDIGEYTSTLSKSELESFQRSGLETFMERKIESVAPGNDATRQMAKTIDQKRLRHLFPDDESFDRFKGLVARESRMNQTRNFISGQSKTGDKLAELADVMGIGLDVASGNLTNIGRKLLQRGITQRTQGVTAATADEIAKRVTAGATPNTSFLNLLDEVNQFQQTGAPVRRAAQKTAKATFGGIAGGAVSSTRP